MVIFLDIDGVLNRERDWVCKYAIHEPCLRALSMIADKIRYFTSLDEIGFMGTTNI
jgi:hypothetical protein